MLLKIEEEGEEVIPLFLEDHTERLKNEITL